MCALEFGVTGERCKAPPLRDDYRSGEVSDDGNTDIMIGLEAYKLAGFFFFIFLFISFFIFLPFAILDFFFFFLVFLIFFS